MRLMCIEDHEHRLEICGMVEVGGRPSSLSPRSGSIGGVAPTFPSDIPKLDRELQAARTAIRTAQEFLQDALSTARCAGVMLEEADIQLQVLRDVHRRLGREVLAR